MADQSLCNLKEISKGRKVRASEHIDICKEMASGGTIFISKKRQLQSWNQNQKTMFITNIITQQFCNVWHLIHLHFTSIPSLSWLGLLGVVQLTPSLWLFTIRSWHKKLVLWPKPVSSAEKLLFHATRRQTGPRLFCNNTYFTTFLLTCTWKCTATEYTEQQRLLSGVHSTIRVKFAQAGEGGGCGGSGFIGVMVI